MIRYYIENEKGQYLTKPGSGMTGWTRILTRAWGFGRDSKEEELWYMKEFQRRCDAKLFFDVDITTVEYEPASAILAQYYLFQCSGILYKITKHELVEEEYNGKKLLTEKVRTAENSPAYYLKFIPSNEKDDMLEGAFMSSEMILVNFADATGPLLSQGNYIGGTDPILAEKAGNTFKIQTDLI